MKDYKPRPKAPRSGSVGNTLIGIFIGLILGLIIAAAIAIYMSKSPFPFAQQKPKPVPPDAVSPAPGQKKADVAAADKGDKSRFDFYKILPGKEEATPRPEPRPGAEPPRPDAQAAAKPPAGKVETFMLQVGSYQNPSEADNQKARLALLGLEASVEPAELPDRGTWYRVRLGPFRSLSEVNHVRSQLAQNGLEATLVKGMN
jgi:cell division protein FtsN